jgi:hypothetical protein
MAYTLTMLLDEVFSGATGWVKVALVLSAIVMFGGWGLTYLFVIRQCFRERTYGIPLVNICLNFSWELIYSFGLVAPGEPRLLVYGNRLWFVFDILLVYQLFRYGKDVQVQPWVKKHYHLVATGTLILSFLGVYMFSLYFYDVYGLAVSFMMNLLMSVLFIPFLWARPNLRGISYPAAWAKMLGTFAGGAVFCYLWWPLQFADGKLVRYPYWPEPNRPFLFLIYLYLSILIFDLLYIYLVRQRRLELMPGRVDR